MGKHCWPAWSKHWDLDLAGAIVVWTKTEASRRKFRKDVVMHLGKVGLPKPKQADPEDQLKSPVGQLLSAVGTLTALDVNWRTEVHPDDVEGRPDIGVVTDGLLNGHVELKRPGKGARPEGFTGRDRQQWERFQSAAQLNLHRWLGVEPLSLWPSAGTDPHRQRHQHWGRQGSQPAGIVSPPGSDSRLPLLGTRCARNCPGPGRIFGPDGPHSAG